MPRLKDKIAIVTGGAHGIGKAISARFAEEGAAVFLVDIDEKAGQTAVSEIRTKGGEAVFLAADVSLGEQVSRAVRLAAERSGRIDILCNNAAYLTGWHSAAEANDEEWEKSFRVSLMGAQYFTREVLPFMVRQNRGSIINISSVQAIVAARNSAKSVLVARLDKSMSWAFFTARVTASACSSVKPEALRSLTISWVSRLPMFMFRP